MSVDSVALGATAPPALAVRQPAVLSREPIDPQTALGRLFAAGAPARAPGERPATAARSLGSLAPALARLPRRERHRADLLAAWAHALFATVDEGDRVERRVERINRSAYLLARALAGARVPSSFALEMHRESSRRTLPRRSLDALLAAARRAVREPRAATPAEWETRTRELAEAAAEALLGAAPTPATIDAAAGIVRLVRLLDVSEELARGRVVLPLGDGAESGAATEPALRIAVAGECEAIHQLLLRGARGVGDVPLTFRGALAAALALSLRLLGHVEQHPERLLRRPLRLGRLETALVLLRLRRQPIA